MSSKWLSSEEISSKDEELKVEVCEQAGRRTDMRQMKGRKSAKVWSKTARASHKKITTIVQMMVKMIGTRPQTWNLSLQENAEEV